MKNNKYELVIQLSDGDMEHSKYLIEIKDELARQLKPFIITITRDFIIILFCIITLKITFEVLHHSFTDNTVLIDYMQVASYVGILSSLIGYTIIDIWYLIKEEYKRRETNVE